MKLLFDQNLSPRLVDALRDLFPDSQHVLELGLDQVDDDVVWGYARAHGLCIVSKDSDFIGRSFLQGFPPKVICLTIGNCPTSRVEELLRGEFELIEEFGGSGEKSCLIFPS